ncbi:hypothetical protein LCGC14_0825380 [marine sediment metagenome]|uniref:AraC family transcriptional regulator n=2 Tax=root TaxID=1 RepID=A0A831VRM2_9FLAO|nr:AraC family transcriptional regulator [Pricia sp.]HEA21017.1 AraC family transcriptional regulator [Pricia antarctica]
MSKKIGLVCVAALLIGLIWYLFLKPHDYVVRFKTKALPGTINQTIKSWSKSIENAKFLGQENISNLRYQISFKDSLNTYHWKIQEENDSISLVKVYVTDKDHSLALRMAIPFSETDFEKRTKKTVAAFAEQLQDHLKNFKVNIIGRSEIPEKYCACVPLKETQLNKAYGMKQYYSLLSSTMSGKDIVLDGSPMLEVEHWNLQNDSISYNFCFPVIASAILPERKGVFYKKIKRQQAIRAVYNGNYITSDRAWYALLDYAHKNNIEVVAKPLEIFNTNPNLGGNALEWEAEVYLPIKE